MENANVVNEVVDSIAKLDVETKHSNQEIVAKINEIIEKVNSIQIPKRDRGPQSTKEMTEDDARRCMVGDLKDKSHKDAATELGLSYGQIYSARKGYTFKPIYQEMVKSQKQS